MTLDLIVADEVKCMIEEGTLSIGDKLPSERDLCERFNVQRLTLRSGLQMLEEEGLIYSIPRNGYYVANNRIQDNFSFLLFSNTNKKKDFLNFDNFTIFTKVILNL